MHTRIKCFLLFLVTEEHPEVQEMVLGALQEAKQSNIPLFELYTEVLEKHIKEVCSRSETWQLNQPVCKHILMTRTHVTCNFN